MFSMMVPEGPSRLGGGATRIQSHYAQASGGMICDGEEGRRDGRSHVQVADGRGALPTAPLCNVTYLLQQEGIQRIGGFAAVVHQSQAVTLPVLVALWFPVEHSEPLAIGDPRHLVE